MILLFEDNKNMRLSRLLLTMENDDIHFDFAKSNSSLGHFYTRARQKDCNEPILIFIDVVPDNKVTIREYNSLVTLVRDDKYSIVIPTICAEWCAMCLLYSIKINDIRLKSFIEQILQQKWSDFPNPKVKESRNLEDACKKFIGKNGMMDNQYLNVNVEQVTDKTKGAFYDNDDVIAISHKASGLLGNFISFADSPLKNFPASINIAKLQKYHNFYLRIFDLYEVPHIDLYTQISDKVKLLDSKYGSYDDASKCDVFRQLQTSKSK